MLATVDDDGRLLALRGDRNHPMTAGYACFKGLRADEFHNSSDRLLHPMRRRADGTFEQIALEQALDEVADRLAAIIARDGPEAVGCFLGTSGYMNASAYAMAPHWMAAIGSPAYFSSLTIDQSAKLVTLGRLGGWAAGRQMIESADVWMFVGTNPLVSISSSSGLPPYNGHKRLKAAKARGLKLIVVDPRKTETACLADLHLQPLPGRDAALMAALLRIILARGWEDRDFCDRYVSGLEQLRTAVAPFTTERVAAYCGVAARDIVAAAELFAQTPRRGCAGTGTGACMSARSNLADHMVELLNVVCGRYLRAGEPVANPGPADRAAPRRAQVVAPNRYWEKGHRSRIRGVGGFPGLFGMEMATGILADEMLEPGKGQIRSLFVVGGNPATAVPDQRKMTRAMAGLELMVAIDPYLSATARMAHYVFAPKMMYERADLPMIYGQSRRTPAPFFQYARPIATPPAGSEVVDDWYVFWALAKRLSLPIEFCGARLDMTTPPSTDDLLALVLRDAQIPFEEIKRHPDGKIFDLPRQYVEPASPDHSARFDVMPQDVAAELAEVAAEMAEPAAADAAFPYLLASRRMRDAMNSVHGESPSVHRRMPYNPLFAHPDDLAALGIADGGRIEITSDTGGIEAIAAADPSVRPGVVHMSHCFGGLPDERRPFETAGACTNLLVSTDRDCETINAMPRQSGIPVRLGKPARPARQDAPPP
jgi:anaerobic selenocysteine-containing dehydrogenase